MKTIRSLLKAIWRANPKTIYFNFRYLPWKQALHFPFWISSRTSLRQVKGRVELKGPLETGMIRIGYGNIGIFDHKRSRSIWEVRGTVVFDGKAEIGHGSKISVGPEGTLFFGKNFALTAESTIVAYKKVVFGDDCLLSWDILIMDTDYHAIRNSRSEVLNPPSPVIIGNSVWIGCRSLILKGTVIPDGAIIAANSLVNKELTGVNQLFGKNPLSVLASDVYWAKD